MKKFLIFSLLSLIFITALPIMAVKKIEANPINVAAMLIQEKDTASMASTLQYYGYIRQIPPSGGQGSCFIHPNGSKIQYKLNDQNLPTVEVTSKASAKEKEQILKNLNFHKNGNSYEQKSVGSLIKCSFGSHSSIVLTRQSKRRE